MGTFVQLKDATSTSTVVATLATGNFAGNPVAGNCIIVFCRWNDSVGVTLTSFTDTLGNTYTLLPGYASGAADFENFRVGVAKNITGGVNSVSANFSGNPNGGNMAIVACEYSGFDLTTPYTAGDFAGVNRQGAPGLGANAVTSGNTPVLSSGAGTLIGLSYNYTGTTPTNGSGTSRGTGWGGVTTPYRLQDQAIAATTAVASTFTATTNSQHYTFALYLKNAGAQHGAFYRYMSA